ncbi:MAG: hypothetical protein ACKOTF_16655 [Opitutaceae bacterium]
MSERRLDLIVRGGTLVTPAGLVAADLGVTEGRIVIVGPGIVAPARRELDATGAHVLPGVIDAHVHFKSPAAPAGRAWRPVPPRSPPAAAPASSTCRSTPTRR